MVIVTDQNDNKPEFSIPNALCKIKENEQPGTVSINYKTQLSPLHSSFITEEWASEWLLFNANWAIFQLYHGENKLIFNEMMMRSALY